jgi:hypothetical protein
MEWELKEVKDVEYTMDDSGVYVIINRAPLRGGTVEVRADLMTVDGAAGQRIADCLAENAL